jgi:hypothetical protein
MASVDRPTPGCGAAVVAEVEFEPEPEPEVWLARLNSPAITAAITTAAALMTAIHN